jgi:hypothetical protein
MILLGAAAGAAGTTALNAATYVDMAWRGRPTSSTPEETVDELEDVTGLHVPGGEDTRPNRLTGLGALLGIAAGVGVGALYGAGRGAGWRPGLLVGTLATTVAVEVAANGPMTALGVTNPVTWPASSWAADLAPHVVYGLVTAAVMSAVDGGPAR